MTYELSMARRPETTIENGCVVAIASNEIAEPKNKSVIDNQFKLKRIQNDSVRKRSTVQLLLGAVRLRSKSKWPGIGLEATPRIPVSGRRVSSDGIDAAALLGIS